MASRAEAAGTVHAAAMVRAAFELITPLVADAVAIEVSVDFKEEGGRCARCADVLLQEVHRADGSTMTYRQFALLDMAQRGDEVSTRIGEVDNCLTRALTYTTPDKCGWHPQEGQEPTVYRIPRPTSQEAEPSPNQLQVWVLQHWGPDHDEVMVSLTKGEALGFLVHYVRANWSTAVAESPGDGFPTQPPTDGEEAIRLYYEARDAAEGYDLYPQQVALAATATFHPPTTEAPAALQVAGIMVSATPTPTDDGLRISVDLDEAHVSRDRETVPLTFEVNGHTVAHLP